MTVQLNQMKRPIFHMTMICSYRTDRNSIHKRQPWTKASVAAIQSIAKICHVHLIKLKSITVQPFHLIAQTADSMIWITTVWPINTNYKLNRIFHSKISLSSSVIFIATKIVTFQCPASTKCTFVQSIFERSQCNSVSLSTSIFLI